jgi:DNA polymerase
MYASVRSYLQELEESGVEGVPLDGPAVPEAALVTAGVSAQADPHTLADLRQLLGDCQRCNLAATRTRLVFGVGSPQARLLFVGEAPGVDEDRQGEPFVGEAGAILNRIIEAMGLKREQVYICNVLKCRPPANRHPHKDEIETCTPYLAQQIRVIGPELIVALGTSAAQTLLQNKEPISQLRGQFHSYLGIPVMPTFHPSFLLHHKDNKQHYWDVWNDMVQVLGRLGLPVPDKKRK